MKTAIVKNRIYLYLILIIIFGASLRVFAVSHSQTVFPLNADAGDYFSYAYNLRHYGVYSREWRFNKNSTLTPDITHNRNYASERPRPDAARSPGYPFFLYFLIGNAYPDNHTVSNIAMAQAVLGILMIPLIFFISRKLFSGFWPLLPALLTAISPQLIIYENFVLSETLFAFLLLLAVACMLMQFNKPDKLFIAVFSGILIGMATLTRPTLLYFLPVVLIGALPLFPREKRLTQGILLVGGFLLVYSPWVIRNLITTGAASDPMLMINTLLHGHYPDFMYQGDPETFGYPYAFDPRAKELSSSLSAILGEILNKFLVEPAIYLKWYLISKPLSFFGWEDASAVIGLFPYPVSATPYYDNRIFIKLINFMYDTHEFWMVSAIFSSLAIFIKRVRLQLIGQTRFALQIMLLLIAYFAFIHMVGFPLARYCIPLYPIIFALSIFTIERIFFYCRNIFLNKYQAQ